MGRRIVALLLVVLAGASAVAQEAPPSATKGQDEVHLLDGRVLRCLSVIEEGEQVRLTYRSGTVSLPRNLVQEVRLFRDYDPAPHTDEERALAAKGMVRWAGKWITTGQMTTLRRNAEKAALKAWEENEAHLDWDNRWKRKTGQFYIEANLSKKDVDRYEALLKGFYDYFTSSFKVSAKNPIRVLLYRSRKEFDDFRKKDARSTGEHTVGYFVPRVGEERLVLFHDAEDRADSESTLLHEATHLLIHLARPDVGLPSWVEEGLAEYYSGFLYEKGRFTTGRVQEGRLLGIYDMLDGKGLLDLEDLFRAGHPDPKVPDMEFGLDHYAQSWLLLHYLMQGEKGKYRNRFAAYLNSHLKLSVKDAVSGSSKSYMMMPYPADQESLHSNLKVQSWEELRNSLAEYARTLPLDSPWAFLARATRALAGGKDTSTVESDLDEAFRRGYDDSAFLLRYLDDIAGLPGMETRVVQVSERLRFLDPADAGVRIALAPSLDPEDRDRELALALELDPLHLSAGVARAWLAHRNLNPDAFVPASLDDALVAREKYEATAALAAASPGDAAHAEAAWAALHARLPKQAHDSAVAAVKAAPTDPAHRALETRCAAAAGRIEQAVAALKAYDKLIAVARGDIEGTTITQERRAWHLDQVLLDTVETCWALDQAPHALQVLSATYDKQVHLPYGEGAWILLAAATLRAAPPELAVRLAEELGDILPTSRFLQEFRKDAMAAGSHDGLPVEDEDADVDE